MSEKESASSRDHVCQFSGKTDNFDFFGPNLPKNGFRGSQFQKSKSEFGISTPKIPWEPISSQNEQLWIFRLKFGKIAQLREYFGSNNVECVAESWIKAEMSWVEMDGAG